MSHFHSSQPSAILHSLKVILPHLFLAMSFFIPSNLHAASVSLTWNANSESDLAGYKIYKRLPPSLDYSTPLFSVSNSIVISNLTEGATYGFIATAIDTSGNESDFSIEKEVTVSPSSTNTASIQVNFQPTTSSVPSGYLKDDGSPYDSERGYGWSEDLTGNTWERHANTDQRLDTGIQISDRSPMQWNYDLPNGNYTISLASGDPTFMQGPQLVSVEDLVVFNHRISEGGEFLTITDLPVTITDGTLTITLGSTPSNSLLNYVQVNPEGASSIGPPALVSPAPGSVLPGASATFTWAANGTPVTQWAIQGGNTAGSGDLFDDGGTIGTNTSFSATNLPTDGRTIFIKLWYQLATGWEFVNTQYTASSGRGGGSATIPALVSPLPGTVLPGASATFTWAANGTPVTQWAIQGGNTAGSGDLFDDGGTIGTNTSFSATNLPTDGRTIFIKLWYQLATGWEFVNTQYTASSGRGGGSATIPALVSPLPGTVLPGASATFTWAANGTPVTQWAIQGGNTAGSGDLFDDGGTIGTNTSFSATNLPTDGRTIFIKLWYQLATGWEFVNTQYTASSGRGGGSATIPALVSPLPGTVLPGASATFTWAANGTPVTQWAIQGGNTAGSGDLFDDGGTIGTNTSFSATNLPTDGRTIFIKLWYQLATGWEFVNTQYTASSGRGGGSATIPALVSPLPGTVLPGASATFTWAANGTPVTQWAIQGGNTAGSGDLFDDGGTIGTNTSFSATNLPTDGRTIFIKLWYQLATGWEFVNTQYTASSGRGGGSATIPALVSPLPGTVLPGASATFTWAANGTPVTQWAIQGGNTAGSGDLFDDGGTIGTNTSFSATNLPTDGRTIFIKLWYQLATGWEFVNTQYTASSGRGGGSATIPALVSPLPGTVLPGASATFTWAANGTPVTQWAIQGGNTAGSGDLFDDGGTIGTNTSFSATNLPTDGRTIFIKLWYQLATGWESVDVQYTAGTR